MDIDARIADELRRGRKEAKQFADAIIKAIRTNDCEELLRIGTCEDYYGGWERVFRRIDRGIVPDISPDIKNAFQPVWIEHNNWPLSIGKPKMLALALRKLLPPYHGPAVTLYRGASRHGWRRGFSWTAEIERARQWANNAGDDAVVVQASVQPEAIICKIEYAEPFTEEEKAEILREHPNAMFDDFSAEQEYVVDPAGLTHWKFLPRLTPGKMRGASALPRCRLAAVYCRRCGATSPRQPTESEARACASTPPRSPPGHEHCQ